MKRKLVLFSMLLTVTMLSAQEQWFGVQVGFAEPILRQNITTLNRKLSDVTRGNGFKVGFAYDVTLIEGFGLNVAINYSYAHRGGKWVAENPMYPNNFKTRETFSMHMVELPIEWQYKFNIANDTWLILYTGPTLQYNFAYNTTTTRRNTITNEEKTEKINHYSTDIDNDGVRDYTPFNIQWGVGAGFQYKNYYIRGGYNFGIYNHFRDNFNDKGSYTNRARFDEWNIRLGFYFLNFGVD